MAAFDTVSPDLVDLIYSPRSGEVMHSVTFASGNGTNFEQAVLTAKPSGSGLSVDLLVTDKQTSGGKNLGALEIADAHSVDHRTRNAYKALGSWQKAQQTARGIQEYQERVLDYNLALLGDIQEYEREHGIHFDIGILAGWMRFVRGALLRRFNNRMINVHPADLSVLDDNRRRYVGDNAVYDALAAGEQRTRSSVILIDAETDAQAILASGPWVAYDGPRDIKQESADEHQKVQKGKSDHPTLRFVLRALAKGKLGLHRRAYHADGCPVVVYNGVETPYQGVDLAQRPELLGGV